MNTKKLEIVNGPSKSTLIDAFKYAYDKKARVFAYFTARRECGNNAEGFERGDSVKILSIRMPIRARITSLQYEDGGGESFILNGYCEADLGTGTHSSYKLNGHYDTKKRIGHLILEE